MWKYVIKRLLALIPVILAVTLLVYWILSMTPGDPVRTILGLEASEESVAALREEMGLNDSVIVQYFRYVSRIFRGNFGNSYVTRLPVTREIFSRLPYTLVLAAVGIILTVLVALPLGLVAGIKQNSLFDNISMALATLGISLPTFWLGLLGILLFSVKLRWLPASDSSQGIKSIILPAMALSLQCLAGIARNTRSSMLEVIRSDYIRTARSKGLSKPVVVLKHALPNAMIPTLTVAGLQLCNMISSTILVENVFSWPGIGRLFVSSIGNRDIPLVLGCVIVFVVCFSVINLLVDLLYAVFDPQIRAQYQ